MGSFARWIRLVADARFTSAAGVTSLLLCFPLLRKLALQVSRVSADVLRPDLQAMTALQELTLVGVYGGHIVTPSLLFDDPLSPPPLMHLRLFALANCRTTSFIAALGQRRLPARK